MADFMPRFLLCNLLISMIILIFLAVRYLFYHYLTNRMRYHLWYLLLGLLAVPFLPASFTRLPRMFSLFGIWNQIPAAVNDLALVPNNAVYPSGAAGWMNDISVSVGRKAPSVLWMVLSCLWIAGMCVVALSLLRTLLQLHQIRRSAMPVQNAAVRRIYNSCLAEMQIKRSIPLCSTAYFSSPVITGLFRPCIYLPSHLTRGYASRQLRYMFLHELQHYRHKDTLANHLMNVVNVIYWFHPFVRYMLKEMRADREIACDTSVLNMLQEDDYEDYGNTLLVLARQASATVFPFASGIHTGMAQMKKRVLNIAGYQPPSRKRMIQGMLAFVLTAALLFGFVPVLSANASDQEHADVSYINDKITELDLRREFGSCNGSFVLYDSADSSWQIYNKDHALTRTAPASTYKIYSALLGLETGVISQEQSVIPWDGQEYIYPEWNTDQDLISAMQHSVTWYFQALDRKVGLARIKNHIRRIRYGNQVVTGNTDYYWIDGGLKISPVEQVELLKNLADNTFGFSQEHMDLVKQSIRLADGDSGTLYGKTGTVSADGKNISGWLVGYVETNGRNRFFAVNIQKEDQADGPAAAQIALKALARLGVWKENLF